MISSSVPSEAKSGRDSSGRWGSASCARSCDVGIRAFLDSFPTCMDLVRFFGICATRDSRYWTAGRLTLCTVCARILEPSDIIRSALEVDVTDQKVWASDYRSWARTGERRCSKKNGMQALLGPLFAYEVTMLKLHCALAFFHRSRRISFWKTSRIFVVVLDSFERVISKYIKSSNVDDANKVWLWLRIF